MSHSCKHTYFASCFLKNLINQYYPRFMSSANWQLYHFKGCILFHLMVCAMTVIYHILWCIMRTYWPKIFEGEIKICIIHGYYDYMPWYNNRHNNPMYNAHKRIMPMDTHYSQQNTVLNHPLLLEVKAVLNSKIF